MPNCMAAMRATDSNSQTSILRVTPVPDQPANDDTSPARGLIGTGHSADPADQRRYANGEQRPPAPMSAIPQLDFRMPWRDAPAKLSGPANLRQDRLQTTPPNQLLPDSGPPNGTGASPDDRTPAANGSAPGMTCTTNGTHAANLPSSNNLPGPPAMPPDLGKLAHELRTPLSAIVSLAEIMRDEQFGPLGNARYKGYANDIHHSAHHALAVLTAMLDAGPGRNGHADPRGLMTFGQVELNALARGCVSGLQPVAANAGLNLRTALNPQPLLLNADRRSLKQVVLNLLTNAIKFTPAGGTITVATSAPHASTLRATDDDCFRLDVRDTGVGMTDTLIAEVLARDIDSAASIPTRAGAVASVGRPQTGVGLPLARALAEAHGGRITIISQPGIGTTVSLHLPNKAPAHNAGPTTRSRVP
jgi:two-component sensor histidine kinase